MTTAISIAPYDTLRFESYESILMVLWRPKKFSRWKKRVAVGNPLCTLEERKFAKSRPGLVVFAREAEAAGTEASERPSALRWTPCHIYMCASTCSSD
jgi:hypothetical protein